MHTEKIYAGFWIRLFAGLLDFIVLLLVLLPILALVFYFFGFSDYGLFQINAPNYQNHSQSFNLSVEGLTPDYFIYGIGIIYSTYFLCRKNQATIGKKLLGIYVGNCDGSKLSTARALARSGAQLITTATLGFGFFIVIFTKEKISLHDFLCDTRVFYGKKNG